MKTLVTSIVSVAIFLSSILTLTPKIQAADFEFRIQEIYSIQQPGKEYYRYVEVTVEVNKDKFKDKGCFFRFVDPDTDTWYFDQAYLKPYDLYDSEGNYLGFLVGHNISEFDFTRMIVEIVCEGGTLKIKQPYTMPEITQTKPTNHKLSYLSHSFAKQNFGSASYYIPYKTKCKYRLDADEQWIKANMYDLGYGKTSFTIAEENLKQIKDDISALKLPTGANLTYRTFKPGLIDGKYDLSITLSSEGKTIKELTEKADELATQLEEKPEISIAKTLYQTSDFIDLRTGKALSVQTDFNRIGFKEDGEFIFEDSIFIGIKRKSESTDLVRFSDIVHSYVTSITQEENYKGYNVNYTRDFARDINTQVGSLEENALSGLFAVAIVLLLIINWRASLVATIFIPLVLASTFIVLYILGYTLNLITLFALILVLGLFVDDAIVVIEAITKETEKGVKGLKIIQNAISQIGISDISGTLTTVLVFFPMMFISGILGDFIRQIPITVIIALLISLILALTIIPLISVYVIRKINRPYVESIAAVTYLLITTYLYLKLLDIPHRPLKMVFVIGLVTLAMLILTPISSHQKKDVSWISRLNGFNMLHSAFGSIVEFIGKTLEKYFNFAFKNRIHFVASTLIVISLIGILSVVTVVFSSKLTFSIFPAPKDGDVIEISNTFKFEEIEGYEDKKLNNSEKLELAELVSKDLEDIIIEKQGSSIKEYAYIRANGVSSDIRLQLLDRSDREDANMIINDLKEATESFDGTELSFRIASAGPPTEEYPVSILIFEDEKTETALDDIEKYVKTKDEVKDVVRSDSEILTKSDGKVYASLKVKFVNNEDSSLIENFKQDVTTAFQRSYDIEFDLGGETENQESFASTVVVFLLSLVFMYILLVIQYNSFTQPFIVFLSIPLTLPGVLIGLSLTNNPISFFCNVRTN